MRIVSVREWDRLCCDVVDRGWRTYYHRVLETYVIVRPLPHLGNHGWEYPVHEDDLFNTMIYEHVRAEVRHMLRFTTDLVKDGAG